MHTKQRQWWIFLSTSLLLVLMNIDMTAVNLALAPIAVELRLSILSVQSVISAYLIGGAALVMLGGLLGDLYGRKNIFLLGAGIFTLASLGVALASSEWSILLGRLIQGFGAALAWPLAIVIVRETFVGREGFAMGLISAVMAGSMAIGPPIGGLILHYLDWRWIFLINLPLGALVMAVGIYSLPGKSTDQQSTPLHLPSAALLVVGLLLFVFALSEMPRFGLQSPRIYISLISGLTLLLGFAQWQARLTNPLIELKLFRHVNLSSCFIVRFIWQVIWIANLLILSLLLQNNLGYSAGRTSLYFLALTIAFAFVAPFGGILSEKFGARLLITVAFVLYIFSFTGFIFAAKHLSDSIIIAMLVLFGLGTGLGMPALLNETLLLAPSDRRGMVSGILYGMNFFGGAIGAILVGAMINHTASRALFAKLSNLGEHLNASIHAVILKAATGVQNVYQLKGELSASQSEVLIPLAQQSFLHAFSMVMLGFISLSIVSMLFVHWIREE